MVKSKVTASPNEEKKYISESLINKSKSKKGKKQRRRGIVYIKHLPHGFFEEQLRGYFSQFGAITRLRLARSPKTLKSKGYAFIEFRYPEVAEIAAEAMNNYMMFKNIIKTAYIAPKDIKYDYFRSGIKRIKEDGVKVLTSRTIEANKAIVEKTNRLMTDADQEKRLKKIAEKLKKHKAKAAKLGIALNIDHIASSMGDEIVSMMEKYKPVTVENSKSDEDSDTPDQSFDLPNLNYQREDDLNEFEDYTDSSEDSDNTDNETDREEAVKAALETTMKVHKEKSTLKKLNAKNNSEISKKTPIKLGIKMSKAVSPVSEETDSDSDSAGDDEVTREEAVKTALEATVKVNEEQYMKKRKIRDDSEILVKTPTKRVSKVAKIVGTNTQSKDTNAIKKGSKSNSHTADKMTGMTESFLCRVDDVAGNKKKDGKMNQVSKSHQVSDIISGEKMFKSNLNPDKDISSTKDVIAEYKRDSEMVHARNIEKLSQNYKKNDKLLSGKLKKLEKSSQIIERRTLDKLDVKSKGKLKLMAKVSKTNTENIVNIRLRVPRKYKN